jgi:hypothetical protein
MVLHLSLVNFRYRKHRSQSAKYKQHHYNLKQPDFLFPELKKRRVHFYDFISKAYACFYEAIYSPRNSRCKSKIHVPIYSIKNRLVEE